MDILNSKFDTILKDKEVELISLANSKTKNRKMTQPSEEIAYSIKTALYKINAEQDRKLKSSKAYQNQEQIFTK